MKESTVHFFKSIGFTSKQIESIHKTAGKNVNILPRFFMRQLRQNLYVKIVHKGANIRYLSVEDFSQMLETFKKKVLKNPLKAAVDMAKGNILKKRD